MAQLFEAKFVDNKGSTKAMQKIAVGFKDAAKDLEDFTKPLTIIGNHMLGSVNQNFKDGGRPEQWKALNSKTEKRKKKKGGGARSSKTLIDKGRMRQTVIAPPPTKTEVKIFPTVDYAVFHETGTKHMPRRSFMLFQDQDLKFVDETFDKFLDKALKEI